MRKSSISTPLRVRNDLPSAAKRNSTSCQRNSARNSRLSRQSFSNIPGRRSSIQPNGSQNSKPPCDRHTVPKQVKQLITFLTENGFPHQLNQQNFTNSPYTKDVQRIFEFLLSLVNIEYPQRPGTKFDEEFLKIMKILRYPYTIGKRQLQPIGSSHNWPFILYALIWISNGNNYLKNLGNNPIVVHTELCRNEDKIKSVELEVDVGAYEQFMTGEDDLSHYDEQFLDELPKMMRMNDVRELEDQAAILAVKKEEMNKDQELLDSLQIESNTVEVDCENMECYLVEIKLYKGNLENYLVQTNDANENLKKECETLQLEVNKRETLIVEQRVIEHNVQALKATLISLEKQVVDKEEIAKKIQNDLLESEVALAKEKDELQDSVEEYHSIAQECNLIPVTASNSQGFDYSISILKPEADTSQYDAIAGRLKLILKQWQTLAHELNIKERKAKDTAQHFEDIHATKLEDINLFEAKKRRQQEAIDLLIKENESEVKILRDRIAGVEEELTKLRKHDKESYDVGSMQNTNVALELEVRQLYQQGHIREQEIDEFLLRCCEIIADHKQGVEQRVQRFRDLVADCCDELEKCKIDFALEKFREKMNLSELEKEIDKVVEKRNFFLQTLINLPTIPFFLKL